MASLSHTKRELGRLADNYTSSLQNMIEVEALDGLGSHAERRAERELSTARTAFVAAVNVELASTASNSTYAESLLAVAIHPTNYGLGSDAFVAALRAKIDAVDRLVEAVCALLGAA